MDQALFGLPPSLLMLAVAITLFAGFVKGAVGFAMPMIMISALSGFLPAPTALALLIVPTLLTNLAQAFRNGWRPALGSALQHWRLLAAAMVMIALSAPLVTVLPGRALLLLLGLPILLFAVSQLLGRQLVLHVHHRHRAELLLGALGGFFGGISGVWGPPVIAYLLSCDIGKTESMRIQGVLYLIGSGVLLSAHLRSGVLNAATLPASAAMAVPAALGMWLGIRLHDRLDAGKFRKATLVVLVVAALNLIRKGLTG